MEIFNFNIILFSKISPMHSRRCYVSVVELNGYIYAMGGFNGEIRLNSVERYDPVTNQWSLIESMNNVRSDAHACVLNNKIYITGSHTFLKTFVQDITTVSVLKVDLLVNFAYRPQKCSIPTQINGRTLLT